MFQVCSLLIDLFGLLQPTFTLHRVRRSRKWTNLAIGSQLYGSSDCLEAR